MHLPATSGVLYLTQTANPLSPHHSIFRQPLASVQAHRPAGTRRCDMRVISLRLIIFLSNNYILLGNPHAPDFTRHSCTSPVLGV